MSFFKKLGQHLVAPKADVNLQLFDEYVVLGDSLDGNFTILPHETIDAEEIRCELNCIETAQVQRTEYDPALKRMVTRSVTETHCLYQAKPVCNPATQLINGLNKTFKFSINIPASGRPTYMSIDDNVIWEVKGVIAVHGRPDVTTKTIQLQVIPQNQRPTNEPPKIRLVTCEYCQAAYPETALACPNCGAKREI